jgi:hypothetical protein
VSQPQGAPDRADVISMLASFGDRGADAVAERIGSLELTWLITQVEERYAVTLELSDQELAQMSTVSGAIAVLHDVLAGSVHG